MFSFVAVLYFVLFFSMQLYTLIAGIIIAGYFILLLIGTTIEIYRSLKSVNNTVIIQLSKKEDELIKICKLNNMNMEEIIPIGASVKLEMDQKDLYIENTGILVYDCSDTLFVDKLRLSLIQIQNEIDSGNKPA